MYHLTAKYTVFRWASLRLLLAPLKWDDYVFQILEFSVHRIREKRGKNSFQFQCGVPVLVPTLVKSYYQLWSLVGQASPNAQTSIHRVSVFVPTSAKLCISNYGPSLDRPVPVPKLVFISRCNIFSRLTNCINSTVHMKYVCTL